MTESPVAKVVNCHWFGGSDKLPANTRYIGRPGPYGNRYSSLSGKYTKEECVALHRADLYLTLTQNPTYLTQLRNELDGQDLACWCKQPKRIYGCHGDNYLHVLSPHLRERTYDKGVLHYLIDDLRTILKAWEDRLIAVDSNKTDTLLDYIHLGDVRIDINHALFLARQHEVSADELCFFIAKLVIELELAFQETDPAVIRYRFDHAIWNTNRFVKNRQDREFEPIYPTLPIKRKSKG